MEPQYHQHQGFSSASPYCVTDLMDQRVAGGSRHPITSPGRLPYPPPAPPQQHQQISLPPVFTPQTYNLQEMHQQVWQLYHFYFLFTLILVKNHPGGQVAFKLRPHTTEINRFLIRS